MSAPALAAESLRSLPVPLERLWRALPAFDAVGLFAVAVTTALVRYGSQWPTYPTVAYLVSFALVTTLFLGAYYLGGHYELTPRLGAPPVLPRTVRLNLLAAAAFALVQFAATSVWARFGPAPVRALPMPLWNLVVFTVVGALVVTANRRAVRYLRRRWQGRPRVLLVGPREQTAAAAAQLATDPAVELVGAVADERAVVGECVAARATDVLLLAGVDHERVFPTVTDALETLGVTVLQQVTARDTMMGLQIIREVGGLPFVLLRRHTLPVSRQRLKRCVEVVVLTVAAPLYLPLLVAVAGYQLAFAGAPVLYRQARVGKDGQVFTLVKFRTMRPDAEADGRAQLSTAGDDRVIAACRWLRATRLDELPQLLQVWTGKMSLVGPRPERPEIVADLERTVPGYRRRHDIPPGLTGLAQVNGRYATDAVYKLGYDLNYLVNWSPVLDALILARTVGVVLARRV